MRGIPWLAEVLLAFQEILCVMRLVRYLAMAFQWQVMFEQCSQHHSYAKCYIFLTAHLRIILVGNHLDAQFLLWYVYLNSLHVSRNPVLILRRTILLTLILLMWRIWWAPNNASRWQMGFKSVFKGLIQRLV